MELSVECGLGLGTMRWRQVSIGIDALLSAEPSGAHLLVGVDGSGSLSYDTRGAVLTVGRSMRWPRSGPASLRYDA